MYVVHIPKLPCISDNCTVEIESPVIPPVGSIVSVQLSPHPTLLYIRNDLTKDFLQRKLSAVKYEVKGNVVGPRAKCKGCDREIGKDQLRISTVLRYNPGGSGPYLGKGSFCVKSQCITTAYEKYKKKVGNGHQCVFAVAFALGSVRFGLKIT